MRLRAIDSLGLGSFGGLDLSGVWRYNSGLSYSLVADGEPLSDEQIARTIEAGYLNAPNGGEQEIYFGERGSESFPGYGLVDFGVNYSLPIWRTLRPYLKIEVLNAFNNQKLIGYNTTVSADWDGPVDALGLPLNYIEGPNFGKAEANGDYPVWRTGQTGSRTFLGAFGFRF